MGWTGNKKESDELNPRTTSNDIQHNNEHEKLTVEIHQLYEDARRVNSVPIVVYNGGQ
jgi:hypothetical protein